MHLCHKRGVFFFTWWMSEWSVLHLLDERIDKGWNNMNHTWLGCQKLSKAGYVSTFLRDILINLHIYRHFLLFTFHLPHKLFICLLISYSSVWSKICHTSEWLKNLPLSCKNNVCFVLILIPRSLRWYEKSSLLPNPCAVTVGQSQ